MTELDRLVKIVNGPATRRIEPTNYQRCCECGCGLLAAPGRKFVNQTHYDRVLSLPQAQAEQIIADFRQGVPKRQLARDHGVALSTVKRLLRKHQVAHGTVATAH